MFWNRGIGMKLINVVYEYDYDDVDIILVPDEIADNIELTVRQFNQWLSIPENGKEFFVTTACNQIALGIDTEEFLRWLNNFKIADGTKASIVKQHTTYISKYPMVDF